MDRMLTITTFQCDISSSNYQTTVLGHKSFFYLFWCNLWFECRKEKIIFHSFTADGTYINQQNHKRRTAIISLNKCHNDFRHSTPEHFNTIIMIIIIGNVYLLSIVIGNLYLLLFYFGRSISYMTFSLHLFAYAKIELPKKKEFVWIRRATELTKR